MAFGFGLGLVLRGFEVGGVALDIERLVQVHILESLG